LIEQRELENSQVYTRVSHLLKIYFYAWSSILWCRKSTF